MLLNQLYKLLIILIIFCLIAPEVLAVDPEVLAKKALCRSCLAKIYVAMGKTPEATSEYQELLKLTPNDAETHFDFGNFLASNGKADLAINQFKLAAKLKSKVPAYQVGLGNALMYTKNYDGAVQAYTQACSLGGKYQKQLETAQHYQAQQRLLEQYKAKIQVKQQDDDD